MNLTNSKLIVDSTQNYGLDQLRNDMQCLGSGEATQEIDQQQLHIMRSKLGIDCREICKNKQTLI